MPVKWTSDKHERLFYIMIEQNKPHPQDLYDGWKKKYPSEEPPTVLAIKTHINELVRVNGGGAVKKSTPRKAAVPPKNNVNQAPKTPKTPKSTTPKPPTSSGKRKRMTMSEDEMSDVEESEPELSKAKLTGNVGRRATIPRGKKSARKTYAEDSSDDEDEEVIVDENVALSETLANDAPETATGSVDGFEDLINYDGANEKVTAHLARAKPRPSKKRRIEDDSDAMSDISNFSATLP